MAAIDRALLFLLILGSLIQAIPEHLFDANESVSLCPLGMKMSNHFPSLGSCYGLAEIPKDEEQQYYDIKRAAEVCSTTFGANVPSVNTFHENQALLAISTELTAGCWIGLKCGEDGKWYWLNGEPYEGYTNFDPSTKQVPDTCDPHLPAPWNRENFYIAPSGRWAKKEFEIAQSFICTRRPEGFNPTDYPENTIQYELCDLGWALIDGICYFVDHESRGNWTWDEASADCENKDATLPIILMENQNDRVYWEVSLFLDIIYRAQFWMGLVCSDNGSFTWLDGSLYDYNNFVEQESNCTEPGNGYYGPNGMWHVSDENESATMLVCSKPATVMTTKAPTTSAASQSSHATKLPTDTTTASKTSTIAITSMPTESSTHTMEITSTSEPATTSIADRSDPVSLALITICTVFALL